MNGTVGFLLAVGGVSTIIYRLTTRVENRSQRRHPADAGTNKDYSSSASGGGPNGWNFTDWFSRGGSSCDSSTSWSSDACSSGGGDGGGGGGDGGGGSGGD